MIERLFKQTNPTDYAGFKKIPFGLSAAYSLVVNCLSSANVIKNEI